MIAPAKIRTSVIRELSVFRPCVARPCDMWATVVFLDKPYCDVHLPAYSTKLVEFNVEWVPRSHVRRAQYLAEMAWQHIPENTWRDVIGIEPDWSRGNVIARIWYVQNS